MNIVAFSDLAVGGREFNGRGDKLMAKNRKHEVEFQAHHTVREEVPVEFKTRDGLRVSFEAKKKVKEPVRVKFIARDK
jgi:hypothetical protein